MSNFRLFDITIEEKAFMTDRINLVKEDQSSSSNYFSLIIGNNGTGKSRVLSSIARFFVNELKFDEQRPLFSSEFNFNRRPNKVIAITNFLCDKFPVDKSFIPCRLYDESHCYRDFKYKYLGTQNCIKSFLNKHLLNIYLYILF